MRKVAPLMTRVPVDVLDDIRQVAQYDGMTLAEEVREALEILLEARRNDPAFQDRVRAAMARGQHFLEEAGEPEVAAVFKPKSSQDQSLE
jgi:hypothetical protein